MKRTKQKGLECYISSIKQGKVFIYSNFLRFLSKWSNLNAISNIIPNKSRIIT